MDDEPLLAAQQGLGGGGSGRRFGAGGGEGGGGGGGGGGGSGGGGAGRRWTVADVDVDAVVAVQVQFLPRVHARIGRQRALDQVQLQQRVRLVALPRHLHRDHNSTMNAWRLEKKKKPAKGCRPSRAGSLRCPSPWWRRAGADGADGAAAVAAAGPS